MARIDSRELTAWMAYERVAGPLGPERGDIQAAIIAATIANSIRGKKGRAAKPADFIPQWDRLSTSGSREQTSDDHLRMVRQLQASMGGSSRRRRRGAGRVDTGGPSGQGGG